MRKHTTRRTAWAWVVVAMVTTALAGCASDAVEVADTEVIDKYRGMLVSDQLLEIGLPKIATVHLPIGVTKEAQELYTTRFKQMLGYTVESQSDQSGVSHGEWQIRKNHESFIEANALSSVIKSGTYMGYWLLRDERFSVAYYMVDASGERLTRQYLDDPALFPPALAHAEVQFLTEPKDPYLGTDGGKNVLTIANVASPVFVIAADPSFEIVLATSTELGGRTLLDRLNGKRSVAQKNGYSTDTVLVDSEEDVLNASHYSKGRMIEIINDVVEPDSIRSRGEEWYAYYGLEEDRDSPLVQQLLEFETKLIHGRGDALSGSVWAKFGPAIQNMAKAEAQSYLARREIAAERSRSDLQGAVAAAQTLTGLVGILATDEEQYFSQSMESGLAQMDAVSDKQAALDRAMSVATLAFANFSLRVFTSEPAFQGGIDTDFGRMSLSKNLRSLKETVRDRLR